MGELKRTLKKGGVLIVTFFDIFNSSNHHPEMNNPNANLIYTSMDEILELCRELTLLKTGELSDMGSVKQTVLTFKK